jgi:hypothetical protein
MLMPQPIDDGEPPVAQVLAFQQHAAALAAIEQDVVRPLDRKPRFGRQAAGGDRLAHRDGGNQRQGAELATGAGSISSAEA